jgi:hypothetical protein
MWPIVQDPSASQLSTGALSTAKIRLLPRCRVVPTLAQVLPPFDGLPETAATELTELLEHQDGTLTRAQAVRVLGRARVGWLVRDRLWQVPVAGVVTAHNGPLSSVQRQWVAVHAAGAGAVLAGLGAAVAGGLRRSGGGPIDVLIPAARRADRRTGGIDGVRVHRTDTLPDKDLLLARRPPRTAMARSLVDAAQWARSDEEARGIVAAGCQQRLVRPEAVLDTVDRMPRARRRGLVIDTARMAIGGATSVPEIDFARLCRRYRLPPPDQQVIRPDQAGRPRYLDAYWARYRIHVEIDGYWHTEVESWWADMRRQNELWIAGDRVLRFPAWLVRSRPAVVAAQVRSALETAGWDPNF